MEDKISAAVTVFAGKKCKEFEPHCFTCMAWEVLPDWLEQEHPKLIAQARKEAVVAELQALANSHNWRVQLEDRLAQLQHKNTKED